MKRLTHLLEEKGLITLQEEKALTHPRGAPAVDDQPRSRGWSGQRASSS